eukprot:c19190_g1_i1 orf=124-1350(-)
MARVFALWWSLHLCLPVVLGFPCDDGWEWMSGAARMDGAQFMDFASPLVQMSANAYRYPGLLRSIPGWSLSPLIAPLHPSHGGAHALAYEEDPSFADLGRAQSTHNRPFADMGPVQHQQNPNFADQVPVNSKQNRTGCGRRIIIAFRGTQLSNSTDSIADVCADKLLWEGFDLGSLPQECLIFDSHTLDYFAQALNYTLQVISLYPSVPILLTGHSLGAGLAVLVAGALSHMQTLSVIGFGAPATRKPLLDRGFSVETLENASIIVIGHEWDIIMRNPMEGQVGLLCFYPQNEPSSCKKCMSSSVSPSTAVKKQGLGSVSSVYDIQIQAFDAFEESAPKRADALRRSAIEGLAKLGGKLGKWGAFSLPTGDCMDCFCETHYLKSLIAVVDQGDRPLCQQARDFTSEKS